MDGKGRKTGKAIDKNREKEYNDNVPVSVSAAGEEKAETADRAGGIFIDPEGEERINESGGGGTRFPEDYSARTRKAG